MEEYLRKGFTMDDERLKNPPGPGVPDYFDELLERIRDIRTSERMFYRKVADIYATSIDYDPAGVVWRLEVLAERMLDGMPCIDELDVNTDALPSKSGGHSYEI